MAKSKKTPENGSDSSVNSFKIKRILLELPNYSFFHSVLNKEGDDTNNRFVGRIAIIEKIRSYVYETTRNKGAYLISGFRGMGKTSVVNKALSGLNPLPKFTKYIILWLCVLPLVISFDYIQEIFQNTKLNFKIWWFISLLSITVITISLFGYRSPFRSKNDIISIICSGIMSMINSPFQRHKFVFFRILWNLWIYLISFTVIFSLYFWVVDFDNYNRHTFFWFLTTFIIVIYFTIDLVKGFVTFRNLYNRNESIIDVIIDQNQELYFIWGMSLFILGYFLFFDGYNLCGISSILVGYVLLKIPLKRNYISKLNEKNRTILDRIYAFVDLQHYIVVKVNLGKDSLTEKDVLKYITNELLNKYRGWYYNFKSIKRIVNIFLLIFIIYIGITAIHRLILDVNDGYHELNNETAKVAYFFPSQALVGYSNSIGYKEVDSLLNNKKPDNVIKIPQGRIENYNNAIKALTKSEILSQYEKQSEQEKIYYSIKLKIGYQELVHLKDTTQLDKIEIIPKTEDALNLIHSQNPSIDKTNSRSNDRQTLGYTRELSVENQSFLNKITVKFGIALNTLDYVFIKIWHHTRYIILGDEAETPLNNYIKIIYPYIPDYTVFLWMLILFIGLRFIPSRLSPFYAHFYSIRSLKKLSNQIDASIEIEQSGSAGALKSSIFNYIRKKSYKPLESKDITQKLIHILDDISKISPLFIKTRFIFVFDELDKINTHYNSAISTKEDEFDLDSTEVRYQARRKERISQILSSMKHFLNSAHAKFIFIAGREMYDAALAGISDRESSLDSIFNDNKIYVNSFYTEAYDQSQTDITRSVEIYLCQFLMPDFYIEKSKKDIGLSMYSDYLKKETNLNEDEIDKILLSLKDFIVYLTYRCNGAPRKLSSLIEQYIVPVSGGDIDPKDKIVVGSNTENLYLRLSFYDQYKFSLISYLVSPIFISLGNYLHEYSDKLLVSISYLLDHLFKHHKFGISYRSLSLTPEIVDINKEPQFREFLDQLITMLSKNHLRPILSGIYDFKFNGKIAAEIKFLSKINEYEAAAFNFTLDESIELKRHFNRRLESLKNKNANIIINNKGEYEEEYINNISLLHMMIGDLHFYDEEYQEAIVHYLDAVQIMRQKDIRYMNLYDFVLFVRNKLKLGLAFEKNKMYDNALMTYSELTDLIIRKRNLPLRKFGLARFIISKNELDKLSKNKYAIEKLNVDKNVIKKLQDEIIKQEKKQTEKPREKPKEIEIVFIGRLKPEIIKEFEFDLEGNDFHWKKLYSIDDMATFYGIETKDIIEEIKDLATNYKPLKQYFLQSTVENIRLLYQPLVAKLHLIEKSSPDKIKAIDVFRAIEEFNFLKLPLRTDEKRVIVAEFYNKLGDLLYFKNGTLQKCLKRKLLEYFDNEDIAISERPDFIKSKMISKKLLVTPIDATLFYIKSLAILLIPSSYTKVCVECNADEDNSKAKEAENKNETEQKTEYEKIELSKYYNDLKKITCKDKDEENLKEFFINVKKNCDAIIKRIKLLTNDNNESFKQRYSSEYLHSVGNGIIDLAGALLSYGEIKKESNKEEITKKFNGSHFLNPMYLKKQLNIGYEEVLNLYYCASVIFEGIGEYRLARSQKIKILHVLKNSSFDTLRNISLEKLNFYDNKNGNIIDFIVFQCHQLSQASYDQSGRVDKLSVNGLLSKRGQKTYNGLITGEVEEVETIKWLINNHLLCEIKQKENNETAFEKIYEEKNKRKHLKKELSKFIKNNVTENSIVRSKFNRVLLLSLYCSDIKNKIEEKIEKKLCEANSNELLGHSMQILDCIGAYSEILKAHYIFDINYVTTNNLDLARAHYEMASWCRVFDVIREKEVDKHITAEDYLKNNILKVSTLNYIDEEYHLNLALDYNKKIIDFHSRGNSLQNFTKTASYLDDFFNDNLVHFSIAVERNTLQKNHSKDKDNKNNLIEFYIMEIKKKINLN